MRGVISQAMVMCASSPECVEILDPPPGSVPGDKVVCEGYPGTPDEQLSQKKKVSKLSCMFGSIAGQTSLACLYEIQVSTVSSIRA